MIYTNIIETDRLILREINPRVYDSAFSTMDDDSLKKFFGFTSSEQLILEKRRFMEGMTSFNKSFLNFQLVEKTSGNVIGHCGYHTWYLVHFRAEIGYSMDEHFRGQGFMKEAFLPIIRYGFEQMDLQRIEAFLSTENIPSLRLVEAMGFKYEGLLRNHYFKNDKLEDSAVYGLLKTEFRI